MFPKQSDVLAYRSAYGDPRGRGGAVVSPSWYRDNIVMVPVPFAMAMGTIKISRIPFHKVCAPALASVLADLKTRAKGKQATLDLWGVSKFGGSFNYRVMRGLSTLSMHAFGCAVDLDPANNGLGDPTPRFAQFPEVLKAFSAQGFTWGGDWDGDGSSSDQTRHDGMHWQATQPIK